MTKESGQIFLFVTMVVAVILISTLLLIGGSQLYFSNAVYSNSAEVATALAEAGVDKAIESLNRTGGNYNGEAETFFGDGSFEVKITSKDASTKIIEAIGYLPNKAKPKVRRKVIIEASKGVGVAFNYGLQIGEGGLELGNGNQINGSIYSNGDIIGGNINTISGDVWVAGGSQGAPDTEHDCAVCNDYLLGKDVSGNSILDVASGFAPNSSNVLNKVALKIKKIGNPPDVTVRILDDDNGEPDKNSILTSGTLYSSLVTESYGWIEVAFSSSPSLNADQLYWVMIDSSEDASNYWSWQNDLSQGYTDGLPKWSANWSTGNPTWTGFTGDLSFKIIMGGSPTSVIGGNNFNVGGNVHANTIKNLTIAKDAYYQTLVNSSAANLHPGSSDPPPKVFPISETNINQWKDIADGSGGDNVQSGDITSCQNTLDSKKYDGNITFNSNCIVTVQSPIWITGNFTINTNNTLKLDPSYGGSSGVIVVDGIITLGSTNKLQGTGVGTSLLMALSNYDSRTNDITAIAVNNTGNSGVFYANNGIVEPGNSNTYKELTAWKIKLVNQSTINYETGLSSTLFSSGPSGSYTLVKGTYQVK